jgi:hypothetical protein
LEEDEEFLDFIPTDKVSGLSFVTQHREVSLSLNLNEGRYVIVPATVSAGEKGEFALSVYYSCSKTDIQMRSKEDPEDFGGVIEEEEEIELEDITDEAIERLRNYYLFLLGL